MANKYDHPSEQRRTKSCLLQKLEREVLTYESSRQVGQSKAAYVEVRVAVYSYYKGETNKRLWSLGGLPGIRAV